MGENTCWSAGQTSSTGVSHNKTLLTLAVETLKLQD